jgi:hypothetical protein
VLCAVRCVLCAVPCAMRWGLDDYQPLPFVWWGGRGLGTLLAWCAAPSGCGRRRACAVCRAVCCAPRRAVLCYALLCACTVWV